MILKRLQVAYNNIFRTLMNIGRRESISNAFIDNNVDRFGVLVRKNMLVSVKDYKQ